MTNQLLLTLIFASVASPALPQANSANQPKGPQPSSAGPFTCHAPIACLERSIATRMVSPIAPRSRLRKPRRSPLRKAQLLKQREASFRQMDKDKNGSLSPVGV